VRKPGETRALLDADATTSVTTGRARRGVYGQVKTHLRGLIADLAASGAKQLTSEDDLAAHLEVSRATVRSALLSLQKEGLIQRVHGQGTFINRHALAIRANIAQDWPFLELLSELGYAATTSVESLELTPAPDAVRSHLEMQPAEQACVVVRVFHASDSPAVLCIDYVPARYLKTPVDELRGESSTFSFVREHAGRSVRYSVADLVPVVAEPDVAATLAAPVGQPLLLLRHTHIDEADEPVAFTRAYVNDQYVRFSVVRNYAEAWKRL
jgi:GntR family transcriptional regulator